MATIIFNATLEIETCISCGIQFALPAQLQRTLIENKKSFFCPNGHSQHYCGETQEQKLREELKRKEQELATVVQQKLTAINDLEKTNKQLKRLKNGVCPCCNRSFHNLQQHIKKQHPEFVTK